MDIASYALSKKIAEHAVSGVQSMSVDGQTLTINTKDSGVLTMTFPTPKDGVSVADIDVNANNQIVFTMSDDSEFISGKIPTVKGADGYTPQKGVDYFDGADGVSPIVTVTKEGKIATITCTDVNGTTTATIKDGENSEGGEANIIESISVNGTPVSIDENKNVDITVPSIEGLTKDADLATIAKSGDYEDLINKPTIPSLNGYATETWVNEQGYLTEHQDLSAYATKEEIPSKVSELTNDSNYQTAEQVNSAVTTEIAKVVADAPEDFDTLKEMSDWIAGHADDASAMNSAISDNKTAITALQTGKADKSEIPTTLPANGGNSDTVNNHTVETDVPTDAVFTDTIYDDTEVKESIEELSSNLDGLGYGENAGGKNLLRYKFKQGTNNISTKTPILLKAGKYTISGMTNDDKLFFVLRYVDGKYVDNAVSQSIGTVTSYQFTLSSDMYACFQINATDIDANYYNNSVMIEKGTTATDYEPYIPSVKMLAEENAQQNTEAMDLKMLGWSVPRECPIQNEVNGNQFIQKVGRVDLGSLDWTYHENSGSFYTVLDDGKKTGVDIGVDCYLYGYECYKENAHNIGNNQVSVGSSFVSTYVCSLVIKNTSYTDTTTFKNANKGVYLYYELAEEKTITVDGNEAVTKANESFDTLEFGEVAGGKNLFKYNEVSGTLSKTVEYSLDVGTYTISALVNSSDTDSSTSLIDFYYEDGTNESYLLGRESRTSYTITLTKHVIALVFYASTDLANSANDTFTYSDIQIEKGTTATDYEPYIPSVKMLADEVSTQNESLSDYGFVAKEYVSNDFLQGVDINGNITSNNYYVCNKNIISANAGDTITVKSIANSESYVAFYDGSTFKSFITIPASSINNFVFSIPSGSNGFRISIGVSIGVTPSTIGEVKIFTNNAIDELKNDLTVKPVYIPSNDAFGTVSDNASYVYGKLCVLSFKFTTSSSCTKHSPIVPNGIKYFSNTGEILKPLGNSFLTTNKYNNGFYVHTNGNIYVGDDDIPNGTTLYVTGSFMIE